MNKTLLSAIGGALLMLCIVLIISSCGSMTAQASKSIPAKVDGVVVDHAPRTEPVVDASGNVIQEAQYFLIVDMNGDRQKLPVTVETAVKAWIGYPIKLDCSFLPCKMDGG